MMYLMEHQYTDDRLCIDVLEDVDHIRGMRVQSICQQYDLALFLADVEREVSGPSEDEDVIDEISEDNMTLTRVVDCDGTIIARNVHVGKHDLFQVEPFDGRMPDNQESEEWEEDWDGTETFRAIHWYEATVCLLHARPTHSVALILARCFFSYQSILFRLHSYQVRDMMQEFAMHYPKPSYLGRRQQC